MKLVSPAVVGCHSHALLCRSWRTRASSKVTGESPDQTRTCLPSNGVDHGRHFPRRSSWHRCVIRFLTSVSGWPIFLSSSRWIVHASVTCRASLHTPPVPSESFYSVSPFATTFLPSSHFAVAKLIWENFRRVCGYALTSQCLIGSTRPHSPRVTLGCLLSPRLWIFLVPFRYRSFPASPVCVPMHESMHVFSPLMYLIIVQAVRKS